MITGQTKSAGALSAQWQEFRQYFTDKWTDEENRFLIGAESYQNKYQI